MKEITNNQSSVQKRTHSSLRFWIPFVLVVLISVLFFSTGENTAAGWGILLAMAVVMIFLKKLLADMKLIYWAACWILISAVLFITAVFTEPIPVNRPAVSSAAEMMPTEVVFTQDGLVSGLYNNDKSVKVFAGIPYAAPPVGELRWKAPQPVQPWNGVRQLNHFSDAAMQNKLPAVLTNFINLRLGTGALLDNFSIKNNERISEDCLYLNVWTSAKSSHEKRPVIVYIHGGSFKNGSGSMDLYNGENMAEKGAVFVNINYRLGIFGFMANPELTKESGYNASGNYGILDQIAALEWVKHNISEFGGDPDNVTIAGESAGAGSVNILTASPLAKGLFEKAIGESGAFFNMEGKESGGIYMQTLAQAEKEGAEFQKSLNKASLADLRKMSAPELLKAAASETITPIVDGYVLPDTVYNIFEAGRQNDVPALVGSNADEGTLLTLPWPVYSVMDANEFKSAIGERFGDLADEVLKLYPSDSDSDAQKAQLDISTDKLFTWQMNTWAKLQSKTGESEIYSYYFDKVQPGPARFRELGAYHSAEIAYAYNNLDKIALPYTNADKSLSDIMSSYWINFAETGDPNGESLPLWTPYHTETDQTMVLGDKPGMTETPRKAYLEFFDLYEAGLRSK
ncbi:carboxylesterase/lipase family protein [Paenibacillus sp. S150]|uniref:carboxylesterase/lipase family protein n=1 Tax=Paenibacillus sp. S150 TaxID=2749826 RepID=UPI001C566CE5|nr:carboxylesterase family protein [Paenibacillus sp. S150]MBW4079793.1 carboxylesterase family protein [Paenibacillus sp. S150]